MTQLQGVAQEETLVILPQQGKLRAELYRLGTVVQEVSDEAGGWQITVKLTPQQKQELLGKVGNAGS